MFANALRGARKSAPLKKVCGGPRTGKREDVRAAILCIQILSFLWLFGDGSLHFALKHCFEPWVKVHEPSDISSFCISACWSLTCSV